MRSLPEGAGSPISRMPLRTKGGLLPTHQPFLFSCCRVFFSVSSSGKSLVHYFFLGFVWFAGFLYQAGCGFACWLCKLSQAVYAVLLVQTVDALDAERVLWTLIGLRQFWLT